MNQRKPDRAPSAASRGQDEGPTPIVRRWFLKTGEQFRELGGEQAPAGGSGIILRATVTDDPAEARRWASDLAAGRLPA
jgi:hypothetical protein